MTRPIALVFTFLLAIVFFPTADAATPPTDILIILAGQADLEPAATLSDRRARSRRVCDLLQETAARTQPELRAFLDEAGVDYRTFWICNAVAVSQADAALVAELTRRGDVARVVPDPLVPLVAGEPGVLSLPAPVTRTIPWNIEQIGAPEVWATGNTGQAGVVGILDSGCDWTHPAVRDQYRGWSGTSADHDYNWYDAVHSSGGACGPDAPEPCDDLGHGTHVLGTAVGDDGQGMQIGVAPGARWIACRCIDGGWSSPSMMYEGFEWMLAPRPVGGGVGDPALAPDVITTAWYCPPGLGCAWDTLLPVVAAVRAAGIMVVGTAGGGGPGCETIIFPPAIYDETYTVGASAPGDGIASFSGRGPVSTGQGTLIKPDIVAPGIDILSCLPGDDYSYWSGGAMANAHLAGVVALVVTAAPDLRGDPEAIEARLNITALQLMSGQCGDGQFVPNSVYGYGRIDVAAACGDVTAAGPASAPSVQLHDNEPNPFNPRTAIVYELKRAGAVELRIHDAGGRLVRILVSENRQAAGRHSAIWDGRDDNGRDVAAGVYLSSLQSGEARAQGRLVLIR